MIHLSFYKPR